MRVAWTARLGRTAAVPLVCAGLAACQTEGGGAGHADQAEISTKTQFASADYGVKASPRVTTKKTVRPGGGHSLIGEAYKIAGRWYKPKANDDYNKVGMASWYGPNFHGRLTANGEIYNEYALSAAHPTLPLPCYARVTNETSGDSVIVRINDRGPFASNRIIDLSSEAAGLLHMKRAGVAKVRVQYVGMAPLDGHDNAFLMASYKPGDGEPPASDTGVSGTMLAMNDAAPPQPSGSSALPGVNASSEVPVPSAPAADARASAPTVVASAPAAASATAAALVEQPGLSPAQEGIEQAMALPDVGPVPADRPTDPATVPAPGTRPYSVASAYAEARVADASARFQDVMAPSSLDRAAIVAAWNKNAVATY